MRIAYLIAGLAVAALVILNVPRLAWPPPGDSETFGPLRGFAHGMIGVSYVGAWTLIVAGIYQLILGIVYWDMDSTESERWQFTLESGGTAKLLWAGGVVTLLLGIGWGWFVYTNDAGVFAARIASTIGALLSCWLLWLAFPLLEQVGIDRENMGM
ncbi:MAG: hypothetical protein M3R04_01040 [bacterium]|nr:hypothetical protein [bacterium]